MATQRAAFFPRGVTPTALAVCALMVLFVLAVGTGCSVGSTGESAPGSEPSSSKTVSAGGLDQPLALQSISLGQESGSPSIGPSAASATPALASATTSLPAKPPTLNVNRVLADTGRIVDFGVRKGGSAAERRAFDYLLERLREMGYRPRTESFGLPDGSTSHNIIAVAPGRDSRVVVVGAHIDSKPPSPGANDSAVACALLLEYARLLKEAPTTATIELDFFGAEEYVDTTPGHHHYGSRHRVAAMSKKERRLLTGMISTDVIGVGDDLHARTMGVGPKSLSNMVLKEARRQGVRMTYLRDPGSSGWSDHEPYERAGYPAVWVERLTDPAYHTARDVTAHLQRSRVKETANVVLGTLRSIDGRALDALQASR